MPKKRIVPSIPLDTSKNLLLDIPEHVLDRVIHFLPPGDLGAVRETCTTLKQAGFAQHTAQHIMDLVRHSFPFMTEAESNEIKKLVNSYEKIESVPLLAPQILPKLLEWQQKDLEPFHEDIAAWQKLLRDEPGRSKAIKKFVNKITDLVITEKLSTIFLSIKTRNIFVLKREEWTMLPITWLLHIRDRLNLSAFQWAQLSNHQDFLNLIYTKINAQVQLLSFQDHLVTISAPLEDWYASNLLQWAISCEQPPAIFFRSHKLDVQLDALGGVNVFGENAFHHAARNVDPTWLNYLLAMVSNEPDLRVKLLEQKNSKRMTPLLAAAQIGNWQAVSILLEHGAKSNGLTRAFPTAQDVIDRRSNRKLTRFHIAAQYLEAAQVQQLLNQNPNFPIDTPDDTGKTLLHIACHRGMLDLVTALLALGAAPAQKDDNGWSALHFAIAGNNLKVIKRIYSVTINYQTTTEGWSIGHVTARYANVKVLEFFKDEILKLDLYDRDGLTPLAVAIKHSRYKTVDYIIRNLPENTKLPINCLHVAATTGFIHINQLASYVDNLNEKGIGGNTALHLAAMHGNLICAYHLLRAGADARITNAQGHLPVTYAKQTKKDVLICLFKLKTYGKELAKPGFFGKSPAKKSPEKHDAAKALRKVLFKDASPETLQPHAFYFTPKGSKTLSKIHTLLLPLKQANLTIKNKDTQPMASSSFSI